MVQDQINYMKKIFIAILVLISVQSFGQNKLYAIRGNLDGTRDSFYVKIFTDSVFDKNGNYTVRTAEYYDQFFEPAFPISFGSFVKCADKVYRNPLAITGVRVLVIPINASAGANLVLTDHPNSEQPLANSQRSAVAIQTHGYTEARLTAIVMALSASANSPRIYLQYSTDGVNWSGDGSGGNISLTSTGAKETAWIALPEGAFGNIYVRVAQNGGNASADPAVGTVTIQLR